MLIDGLFIVTKTGCQVLLMKKSEKIGQNDVKIVNCCKKTTELKPR
ncbi:MAG: hypothetical protein ACI9GY_000759 [Brevundimonas sp.]